MRRNARSGFTLVELLVVVCIIALLIAILLPALARARGQARTAACASNVRSMSLAMQIYVSEWNASMPEASKYFEQNPSSVWIWNLGTQQNGRVTPQMMLCSEASTPRQDTYNLWASEAGNWGAAHHNWILNLDMGQNVRGSYAFNVYLFAWTEKNPNGISTDRGTQAQRYRLPVSQREASIPVFVDSIWFACAPRPGDPPSYSGNIEKIPSNRRSVLFHEPYHAESA